MQIYLFWSVQWDLDINYDKNLFLERQVRVLIKFAEIMCIYITFLYKILSTEERYTTKFTLQNW